MFQNVSLSYKNQTRPAVDDVSLTIRAGETIAFVGPNGCGKTSLLSLIPRLFEPTSGRILVDDDRRSSLPDVWAGGDCVVGGEDLTVAAVEDGKVAARAIDDYLRSKS